MSAIFTQFLREQAAKQKAKLEANKGVLDEWRQAIENLFRKMRCWLAESDPDGIIQIEQKEQEVREADFGRYQVPRLDLRSSANGSASSPRHAIRLPPHNHRCGQSRNGRPVGSI